MKKMKLNEGRCDVFIDSNKNLINLKEGKSLNEFASEFRNLLQRDTNGNIVMNYPNMIPSKRGREAIEKTNTKVLLQKTRSILLEANKEDKVIEMRSENGEVWELTSSEQTKGNSFNITIKSGNNTERKAVLFLHESENRCKILMANQEEAPLLSAEKISVREKNDIAPFKKDQLIQYKNAQGKLCWVNIVKKSEATNGNEWIAKTANGNGRTFSVKLAGAGIEKKEIRIIHTYKNPPTEKKEELAAELSKKARIHLENVLKKGHNRSWLNEC